MKLTFLGRLKICFEVLTSTSGHAHSSQEKQLSLFKRGYDAGFKDAKFDIQLAKKAEDGCKVAYSSQGERI